MRQIVDLGSTMQPGGGGGSGVNLALTSISSIPPRKGSQSHGKVGGDGFVRPEMSDKSIDIEKSIGSSELREQSSQDVLSTDSMPEVDISKV
jgi:hypothetical protein